MIVLDEQVRRDQRQILADWRIAARQIGRELGKSGMQDDQIIPFLLTLKRPTFFTHDRGFFKGRHRHPEYCLVWLDVSDIQAGFYIRRFLRSLSFSTQAERAGVIARVHLNGVHFWKLAQSELVKVAWP